MLALRELQERFFASITSAPGPWARVGFDPTVVDLLAGAGRLDATARLDVYAQMYWSRLHEVLRDDFPSVVQVLGAERFRDLACRYLARIRSHEPSVRWFGQRFADFLDTAGLSDDHAFVPDLARLEWARLAVFDAAPAPTLTADDLRRMPGSDWPRQTFVTVPALTMLASEWPLHDVWSAVREARGVLPVSPSRTVLRVWRQGLTVFHASMGPMEHAALGCATRGEPLASIGAVVASFDPPEGDAETMVRLLLRWIEDGILAAPDR